MEGSGLWPILMYYPVLFKICTVIGGMVLLHYTQNLINSVSAFFCTRTELNETELKLTHIPEDC